jgi:hypothetical protein
LRDIHQYSEVIQMFFKSNSMVSITDMTRRFRVLDFVIDTWILEGLIPEPISLKGNRYWKSDEINSLIAGCPVTFPLEAASSIRKFSRQKSVTRILQDLIGYVANLVTR